ncbi:MAG: hypothetical protein ACHP65_10035 [Legionellales bacterium]
MEFTYDQVPDKSFIQDLKRYESCLDVKWNNKEHRWYIIRQDRYGRWVGILTATKLDNRIIKTLYDSDVWKHGVQNYEDMIQAHNDKIDMDRKRYQREEAVEIAERAWVERARPIKDFFSMAG